MRAEDTESIAGARSRIATGGGPLSVYATDANQMSRHDLTLNEARRFALAAQGFDRPRPGGQARWDTSIFYCTIILRCLAMSITDGPSS